MRFDFEKHKDETVQYFMLADPDKTKRSIFFKGFFGVLTSVPCARAADRRDQVMKEDWISSS